MAKKKKNVVYKIDSNKCNVIKKVKKENSQYIRKNIDGNNVG